VHVYTGTYSAVTVLKSQNLINWNKDKNLHKIHNFQERKLEIGVICKLFEQHANA